MSSVHSKIRSLVVAFCIAILMAVGISVSVAQPAYASSKIAVGTPAYTSDAFIATMDDGEQACALFEITGINSQEEARSILSQVNQVRSQAGAGPLIWDYELEKAAMQRAAEIAIYFAHVRPNGSNCETVFPQGFMKMGENIFAGTGTLNATIANREWDKSPGHHDNMVDPEFTCMGAAMFEIDGATYWVELFGSPNLAEQGDPSFNGEKTYEIEVALKYAQLSMNEPLKNDAALGTTGQYVITNQNAGSSATFSRVKIDPSSFNWTSSDSNAVTVNADGLATVVGAGTAKITATNKTLNSLTLSHSIGISKPSSSTSNSQSGSSSANSGNTNVQAKGWVKSGNRWWFSNGDGTYPTGLQTIDGVKYYFDANGWMLTGWQKIDNVWYYFDGSGAMQTGWKKLGGVWYYLNANGAMLSGKQTIDNTPYFFADSGALLTGWVADGIDWYYYTANGVMTTGWQKVGGKWYFMNTNGKMATQWVSDKGKNYYMNYPNGDMAIGWKKIGDFWYYFDSSGAMQTGWKKLGGVWYYLNAAGVMLCDDMAGINGKYYHFGPSGAMTIGWLEANGHWYYFDGSGAAKQDQWLKSGGKWYFFGSDYLMRTGFVEDNGKTYYLNSPNGDMATGWKEISGKWRYFDGSGALQFNRWIGNYYVGSDGVMATDTWIDGYYVGADGEWVKGESSASNSNNAVAAGSVIYASGSEVYHTTMCVSAQKIKNPITMSLQDALNKGLRKCANC